MSLEILLYDIETAPFLAFMWQPADPYTPHERLVSDRFMLSWSARWLGEGKTYSNVLTGDEARGQDDYRIVSNLAELVRDADIVVGHNLDHFDIPILNGRLLRQGIAPLGPVKTIDTKTLAQRNLGLPYNNLDYLGEYLGLGKKIKTSFDLWRKCYHGDEEALAKMSKYNEGDVVLLEKVFEVLKPYVKGLPRMVDAIEQDEKVCPYCGSDHLIKRGYHRTSVNTFQRYECKDCGRYNRDRTPLKEKRLGLTPI